MSNRSISSSRSTSSNSGNDKNDGRSSSTHRGRFIFNSRRRSGYGSKSGSGSGFATAGTGASSGHVRFSLPTTPSSPTLPSPSSSSVPLRIMHHDKKERGELPSSSSSSSSPVCQFMSSGNDDESSKKTTDIDDDWLLSTAQHHRLDDGCSLVKVPSSSNKNNSQNKKGSSSNRARSNDGNLISLLKQRGVLSSSSVGSRFGNQTDDRNLNTTSVAVRLDNKDNNSDTDNGASSSNNNLKKTTKNKHKQTTSINYPKKKTTKDDQNDDLFSFSSNSSNNKRSSSSSASSNNSQSHQSCLDSFFPTNKKRIGLKTIVNKKNVSGSVDSIGTTSSSIPRKKKQNNTKKERKGIHKLLLDIDHDNDKDATDELSFYCSGASAMDNTSRASSSCYSDENDNYDKNKDSSSRVHKNDSSTTRHDDCAKSGSSLRISTSNGSNKLGTIVMKNKNQPKTDTMNDALSFNSNCSNSLHAATTTRRKQQSLLKKSSTTRNVKPSSVCSRFDDDNDDIFGNDDDDDHSHDSMRSKEEKSSDISNKVTPKNDDISFHSSNALNHMPSSAAVAATAVWNDNDAFSLASQNTRTQQNKDLERQQPTATTKTTSFTFSTPSSCSFSNPSLSLSSSSYANPDPPSVRVDDNGVNGVNRTGSKLKLKRDRRILTTHTTLATTHDDEQHQHQKTLASLKPKNSNLQAASGRVEHQPSTSSCALLNENAVEASIPHSQHQQQKKSSRIQSSSNCSSVSSTGIRGRRRIASSNKQSNSNNNNNLNNKAALITTNRGPRSSLSSIASTCSALSTSTSNSSSFYTATSSTATIANSSIRRIRQRGSGRNVYGRSSSQDSVITETASGTALVRIQPPPKPSSVAVPPPSYSRPRTSLNSTTSSISTSTNKHNTQQHNNKIKNPTTLQIKIHSQNKDVYASQDTGSHRLIMEECTYITSTIIGSSTTTTNGCEMMAIACVKLVELLLGCAEDTKLVLLKDGEGGCLNSLLNAVACVPLGMSSYEKNGFEDNGDGTDAHSVGEKNSITSCSKVVVGTVQYNSTSTSPAKKRGGGIMRTKSARRKMLLATKQQKSGNDSGPTTPNSISLSLSSSNFDDDGSSTIVSQSSSSPELQLFQRRYSKKEQQELKQHQLQQHQETCALALSIVAYLLLHDAATPFKKVKFKSHSRQLLEKKLRTTNKMVKKAFWKHEGAITALGNLLLRSTSLTKDEVGDSKTIDDSGDLKSIISSSLQDTTPNTSSMTKTKNSHCEAKLTKEHHQNQERFYSKKELVNDDINNNHKRDVMEHQQQQYLEELVDDKLNCKNSTSKTANSVSTIRDPTQSGRKRRRNHHPIQELEQPKKEHSSRQGVIQAEIEISLRSCLNDSPMAVTTSAGNATTKKFCGTPEGSPPSHSSSTSLIAKKNSPASTKSKNSKSSSSCTSSKSGIYDPTSTGRRRKKKKRNLNPSQQDMMLLVLDPILEEEGIRRKSIERTLKTKSSPQCSISNYSTTGKKSDAFSTPDLDKGVRKDSNFFVLSSSNIIDKDDKAIITNTISNARNNSPSQKQPQKPIELTANQKRLYISLRSFSKNFNLPLHPHELHSVANAATTESNVGPQNTATTLPLPPPLLSQHPPVAIHTLSYSDSHNNSVAEFGQKHQQEQSVFERELCHGCQYKHYELNQESFTINDATKTLSSAAVEVLKNRKNELSMVTADSMALLVLERICCDDTNPSADIEHDDEDDDNEEDIMPTNQDEPEEQDWDVLYDSDQEMSAHSPSHKVSQKEDKKDEDDEDSEEDPLAFHEMMRRSQCLQKVAACAQNAISNHIKHFGDTEIRSRCCQTCLLHRFQRRFTSLVSIMDVACCLSPPNQLLLSQHHQQDCITNSAPINTTTHGCSGVGVQSSLSLVESLTQLLFKIAVQFWKTSEENTKQPKNISDNSSSGYDCDLTTCCTTLRALVSLTHENQVAAKQLCQPRDWCKPYWQSCNSNRSSSANITHEDADAGCSGISLVLRVLHHVATATNAATTTASTSGGISVSNPQNTVGEKQIKYDICIYCLNILTNSVEATTTTTDNNNENSDYSNNKKYHRKHFFSARHQISITKLHPLSQQPQTIQQNQQSWIHLDDIESSPNSNNRTHCYNSDMKIASSPQWLSTWVVSLTKPFRKEMLRSLFGQKQDPFESSLTNDNLAHTKEDEKDDTNDWNQKLEESLVLAGNGFILLAWLLKRKQHPLDSIITRNSTCSGKTDWEETWERTWAQCVKQACQSATSTLPPSPSPFIQTSSPTPNQHKKRRHGYELMIKTLKAFLNFYHYSMGGALSLAVVPPVVKLIAEIEGLDL